MPPTLRTPNWWDDPGDPAVEADPAPDAEEKAVQDLQSAIDQIDFAVIEQHRAGIAAPGVDHLQRQAERLRDLCRRWSEDPDQVPAVAELRAARSLVDGLDRERWEPRTWEHLKQAEERLSRVVAFLDQHRVRPRGSGRPILDLGPLRRGGRSGTGRSPVG